MAMGGVISGAALALALSTLVCPVAAGLYSEHVLQLDSRNFDQLVMESADTFIVKFMAPWCGHVCLLEAPLLSEVVSCFNSLTRTCFRHSHAFFVLRFIVSAISSGFLEGCQAPRRCGKGRCRQLR